MTHACHPCTGEVEFKVILCYKVSLRPAWATLKSCVKSISKLSSVYLSFIVISTVLVVALPISHLGDWQHPASSDPIQLFHHTVAGLR